MVTEQQAELLVMQQLPSSCLFTHGHVHMLASTAVSWHPEFLYGYTDLKNDAADPWSKEYVLGALSH